MTRKDTTEIAIMIYDTRKAISLNAFDHLSVNLAGYFKVQDKQFDVVQFLVLCGATKKVIADAIK